MIGNAPAYLHPSKPRRAAIKAAHVVMHKLNAFPKINIILLYNSKLH